MPVAKLPSDIGRTHPRFEEYLKQFVESGVRLRRQRTVTFEAADTGYRVRHRLPRKPSGFTVVSLDRAGSVYRSSSDPPSGRHYEWLRSDTAGLVAVIEFF